MLKAPSTKDKGLRCLMELYQEKLYWQIRRIVNEHEDSNDVLQNVFIKVWNYIDRFKEESQLSTWLYRIAYNEAITFITQKKKMNLADWENEQQKVVELTDSRDEMKNELQLALENALETLPEKQKIVFKMRYYDEMSYEQMAEVTGTSVGALKASYHHAVKKIEELVKAALNQ